MRQKVTEKSRNCIVENLTALKSSRNLTRKMNLEMHSRFPGRKHYLAQVAKCMAYHLNHFSEKSNFCLKKRVTYASN